MTDRRKAVVPISLAHSMQPSGTELSPDARPDGFALRPRAFARAAWRSPSILWDACDARSR